MKSRREVCFCMLRCSVTLAGSALLAQLFPARLLAQAPSAADLRAYMRAWFNTFPMETQKLADNVTMFDGPGGTVVVLNGPDGKFVVDSFVAPAWPRLKEALDGLGNAPVKYVIDTHWHSTTPTTTRLFTPPEPWFLRTKTQKSACRSRTICRSYI